MTHPRIHRTTVYPSQMTELDIFTKINDAIRMLASHHNSTRWTKHLGALLVPELIDGVVCQSTDLYAFARREVLETLALVVNPRKRQGCPDSARVFAKLLASDDYAPGRDVHVPEGTPSSLVAFWRAAESDGDAPAMRQAVEGLVYATALAEDGKPHVKLEDVVKCLKNAKSSFGEISRDVRTNAIEFQSDSGKAKFEHRLEGVIDDYASGYGEAAPGKRVAALEINITDGSQTSGVSKSQVVFWRRGISFRYAFEDSPDEPIFVDLSYATCLRAVSATAETGIVALGVREKPRGFGTSDTFDAEDDRWITFKFGPAQFAQAKAFLMKAAAEYPNAFGGERRHSFIAHAPASPKVSKGVMYDVAAPPKDLARVRIGGRDRTLDMNPISTCQTDLTSPRTMEALPANLPAPSPEPVFLTARTSTPKHLDDAILDSVDTLDDPLSPSPSPSQSPKASKGISYRGSPSPSPRSPSPTPSPTPSPPLRQMATRTRQKAGRTEPAPAEPEAPRRSTRFTKSEHKTTKAPKATAKAHPKAPPKAAPKATRTTRTTRMTKLIVEEHECAAAEAPAPSNAPKTSDGKPMLMKRKLGCPAKKVADDVKPTTETRPPLSVQDELDPPAKKTRGRLRKQPVEQKAEAPLAELAPAPQLVKKKAGRGKAKQMEARAAVATTDDIEDFGLGNMEVRDDMISPRVQDGEPAAEPSFLSPKAADASRRNVFARGKAGKKKTMLRRDRSKSPYVPPVATRVLPSSPAASISPVVSMREKEVTPAVAVAALLRPSPARTPVTAPKKKSMLKAKGCETPQSQVSKGVARSLHRKAPPTNITVVAAADESEDEDDMKVPAAKVTVVKALAAKKKSLLSELKVAPRTFVKKKREPKPHPVVESESESEPTPDSATISDSMEEDAVDDNGEKYVQVEAREAPASHSDSGETENEKNLFKNELKSSPFKMIAEIFCGSDENVGDVGEIEDCHEVGLKSHGRVEDSAKRTTPASRVSSKRNEPFLPSPRVAASPPAQLPQLPQTDPLDETEQRAHRAATAESDAWTSMEVPTLFKLSEKASSGEEKRKWEIILEIVLARKTGGTPSHGSPAPAPSKATKRVFPAADTLIDLLGDPQVTKKRKICISSEVEDDEPSAQSEQDGDEPECDDEMAALEKRLRTMRTTGKERAELEIAALCKTFKEETMRDVYAVEVDAQNANAQVAQLFEKTEAAAKGRLGDVVETVTAARETFVTALSDAKSDLSDVAQVNKQEKELAIADAEAIHEQVVKRADKIKTRATKKATELAKVIKKKRKDAASGNSLKSLLLRLAENL